MPSLTLLSPVLPSATRRHRFANVLSSKASEDHVAVTARVTYDITLPLGVDKRIPTKDLLAHLTFVVGSLGSVELEVQTKVNGSGIDASAVVERVMSMLEVVSKG